MIIVDASQQQSVGKGIAAPLSLSVLPTTAHQMTPVFWEHNGLGKAEVEGN